jgi:alpha-L-rhamnosidase
MLNRIQEMTRWTFLSNILSVQSDCPHRERFGYGGDLAVTNDAFMLNFDMATFYAKAARDWHDAAFPNGLLTDTAPFVGIQYCGVGWAMVHPQLLCQLYQYYGNIRLLEEQYNTARRWLDLVHSQTKGHIIQEGLSDHEGLEPAPAPQMVTPLYYQSARLMARLASIIGRDKDAERYTALEKDIKEAYVRNFLEPGTGKFAPYTQASQSFALYLNLVPSEEQEAALEFLLNTILTAHKGHLSTGIYGTKFLLDVLSRFGQAEVANTLINQKSFPGWGYMIENNATTLWEHWALSENTYSHNHPMFGSVSEWFFKWLSGIQPHPKAIGFNRIIIRPQKLRDLKWVKAHYNSIRGKIVSEWRSENGRFRLNISLPANTTATVYIPAESASTVTESGKPADSAEGVRFLKMERGAAVYEIGSGAYSFTSK